MRRLETRKLQLQGLFTPVSLACYNFMAKNDDENKKVTVIIAPIRVAEQEDGSLSISFACNRGPFCHDPYCRYSKMSRELSTS